MSLLRELGESIGLRRVTTLIQSGNMAFHAPGGLGKIAPALQGAIESRLGFRPSVIVRSLAEWRRVVDGNPFAGHKIEPARLLAMFLERPLEPTAARVIDSLRARHPGPEEIRPAKQVLYLHFPFGVGRAKLSMAVIEKSAGVAGTCRNWNIVQKLLDIGEALERSGDDQFRTPRTTSTSAGRSSGKRNSKPSSRRRRETTKRP